MALPENGWRMDPNYLPPSTSQIGYCYNSDTGSVVSLLVNGESLDTLYSKQPPSQIDNSILDETLMLVTYNSDEGKSSLIPVYLKDGVPVIPLQEANGSYRFVPLDEYAPSLISSNTTPNLIDGDPENFKNFLNKVVLLWSIVPVISGYCLWKLLNHFPRPGVRGDDIQADSYQRDDYKPEPEVSRNGRIPVPCPGADLNLDGLHDVLAKSQQGSILRDYCFNRDKFGNGFALDELEAAVINNPILNRREKIDIINDIQHYHEVTLPKFFHQGRHDARAHLAAKGK